VQAYEKKVGITLADSKDSLAMQIQHCHSIGDIATFLQGQVQAINDSQQHDRIFKLIKITVSILYPISSIVSVGQVCWKVWMACFTSLTVCTDIAPTCKGDTRYSWYLVEGMCHSRVHFDILLMSN